MSRWVEGCRLPTMGGRGSQRSSGCVEGELGLVRRCHAKRARAAVVRRQILSEVEAIREQWDVGRNCVTCLHPGHD